MAKKVTTWLTDDMEAASGKDVAADQTVAFSLDGNDFEIDLSTKNATKLRTEMERWAQHARRVGGVRRRTTAKRTTPTVTHDGGHDMDAEQRKAAREWLRNNGYPGLGDRGRIPAEALAAFHERPSVA